MVDKKISDITLEVLVSIRDEIKGMREDTKTGSRAETFRWMVDRIFKLVQDKLEEKK